MRHVALALILLAAAPASAQVASRPEDPPIVTAENDAWYRLREPLQFSGDAYYPAGPTVFFNGNTMVRTGHYNGVPLYADTTVEPYSIVYVPIGGGRMQPYERVRRGELAGTAGSRTPSFPVRRTSEPGELPAAPISPTGASQPPGPISAFTPEPGAVGITGRVVTIGARERLTTPVVDGAGGSMTMQRQQAAIATIRRAETNDGVWLQFMGARWVSAGPAVLLRAAEFVRVGDYAGFPVFARQGLNEDVIYLPTLAGFVAPYKLKQ
jgi:hypothetical protein